MADWEWKVVDLSAPPIPQPASFMDPAKPDEEPEPKLCLTASNLEKEVITFRCLGGNRAVHVFDCLRCAGYKSYSSGQDKSARTAWEGILKRTDPDFFEGKLEYCEEGKPYLNRAGVEQLDGLIKGRPGSFKKHQADVLAFMQTKKRALEVDSESETLVVKRYKRAQKGSPGGFF